MVAGTVRGIAIKLVAVVTQSGDHFEPVPGDLVLDIGAADASLARGRIGVLATAGVERDHVIAHPVAAISQFMLKRAGFESGGVPEVEIEGAEVVVRFRSSRDK